MQPSDFCWNELATADLAKAKEFYSEMFGWQFEEIKMPDQTYTIIHNKDKTKGIGGIWHIPKENQGEIPPHWMTYILVEDIAAAVKKAEQLGAKVMKGVTQAGDMGKLAIIVDPTGAHFAFWEVLKQG